MTMTRSSALRLKETDFFSYSMLIRMYVPVLIEQALIALLAVADTMMASYLSDAATAGVSYVTSINNWVNSFFSSMAAGASVLTSQYIGQRRADSAATSARMALMANGILALAFALILGISPKGALLLLLGDIDPGALGYAVDYFRCMIPAYVFRAIIYICTATLRAEGDTKAPMVISVGMMVLALGLKFVFSYGLDLGVKGFSLATTVAAGATAITAVLMLEFGKDKFRIIGGRNGRKFFDIPMALHSLRVGLPVAVDSSMFQLGVLILARLLVTYGVVHSAANGIMIQISPVLYLAGSCCGTVGLVAVSRSIGAGDKEQAKRYYRLLLSVAVLLQFIHSLLGFIFADQIVRLFGGSEEVYALAARLIRIYVCMAMPAYPGAFVQPQLLRGAGDTKFTMWCSIAIMFLIRVGCGYILGTVFEMGAVGLCIAMGVNWILRTVVFFVRFLSGKWLNKAVV